MLICVTNRKLCPDDFLKRIEQIASGRPHAIMLREKDLPNEEYEALASKVQERCAAHQVPLLINQNIDAAIHLGLPAIHLSMHLLREHRKEIRSFQQIGASVHSLEEALEAQQLGAHYLIAGHIFSTDCKRGVPPRGLSFLEEICHHAEIPVFAIGGITNDKVNDVFAAGAKGMCIMSEAMTCAHPSHLAGRFKPEY
ncbi:thiamine phosphate synthase [Bacillus benzoevorans]|uniref:Thiamine-phosphate pyrophosphorylase n=1 Tax=Bacillus benzoevorans TaxID=1456 RepID=A0A7X0HVQ8_9BACI|nr:thiamine phosphate synthase [Bacillus benzoevorans]MBB6447743.1 thiamine-phosphate pyrophosphorylase [Bacillus benzoevorans]